MIAVPNWVVQSYINQPVTEVTEEDFEKARKGDKEALEKILRRHIKAIIKFTNRYFRKYFPNAVLTEDLINDLYAEVIAFTATNVIPKYDSSRGKFTTLLSVSIKNFIMHWGNSNLFLIRAKSYNTAVYNDFVSNYDVVYDGNSEANVFDLYVYDTSSEDVSIKILLSQVFEKISELDAPLKKAIYDFINNNRISNRKLFERAIAELRKRLKVGNGGV